MKKNKLNVIKSSIFVLTVFILGVFIIKGINKSYAVDGELPNTMKAESPFDINDLVTSATYYRTTGGSNSEDLQTMIKYLSDGTNEPYVAYCLNKQKDWPTTDQNITYTKASTPMDKGYSYIILNGYPFKRFTSDIYDDNYITQLAIWLYEDEFIHPGVLTEGEKNDIRNYTYYNSYIKPLVDAARIARTQETAPNPTFQVSKSNFSYASGYYTSNTINVTSNVSFNKYKVSLTGVDTYQILDSSNNVIRNVSNGTVSTNNDINYGTGFKIKIPTSASITSNEIGITLAANYSDYETYLYEPPASSQNYQDAGVAAIVPLSKTKSVSSSFTLPKGSLTIRKTDKDNKILYGAVVLVTGPNNYSQTITLTTGTTTLENLTPGSYRIEEITPPRGYVLTQAQTVDVTTVNATKTLDDDEITVDIKKKNRAGEEIAGAVIEVYDESTNEVMIRFTTGGPNGTDTYTKNELLTLGKTYVAHEVTAPDGYILDETPHEFTITQQNYNIELTFINDKNSTNIIKVDERGNCFAGAGLALYKSDNTFIERWTSQCNGTTAVPHTVEGLAAGSYYVKEESVPAGYILSSTHQTFTIAQNQEVTQTVTFTNTKRQVTITKIDEDGVPVAGAKLRIYNTAGTYSREITTQTTPTSLDGLPVGSYKVEETKAPDGFVKSNEVKTFEITSSSGNVSVQFPNTRNKLKIAKVDGAGNYVSGAILKLVDSNNVVIDRWVSTNTIHEVSSTSLKHGTYYLEEEEAPNGYIRDLTRMEIEVTENSDQDRVYSKVNNTMDITVLKTDESNNPMEGVTLGLFNSNNERVRTWVTTTEPYQLTNLTYGTYYVKEIATLDGYILDNQKHYLTINANTTQERIVIKNVPIEVDFAKVDSSTNELIAGAKLKLSRVDGNMEPIIWTTTTSKKTIKKLAKGKYILEEIEAPAGYVDLGNKVSFEITETGEKQSIYMKDNYLTASVENKKISVDTLEVAGFKFKLVNENKEEIDTWTSTTEKYTTEELPVGKYFLYETDVPEGYILQEKPYEIMVTNNNTVDTIRIVNNPITVEISKKDFTNGEEVEGAELVLKDKSGETIDTWVSKTTPHKISKLPKGTYKLIETIAPEGYALSREIVEFEVKATGDIQTAVMYNEPKVEVPNTSKDVNKVLYLVAAILLVSGLGITITTVLKKK